MKALDYILRKLGWDLYTCLVDSFVPWVRVRRADGTEQQRVVMPKTGRVPIGPDLSTINTEYLKLQCLLEIGACDPLATWL